MKRGNVKKKDVCNPRKEAECPLKSFCRGDSPACVVY